MIYIVDDAFSEDVIATCTGPGCTNTNAAQVVQYDDKVGSFTVTWDHVGIDGIRTKIVLNVPKRTTPPTPVPDFEVLIVTPDETDTVVTPDETDTVVADTQQTVGNFIQNRTNQIFSIQPNLSGFVNGGAGVDGGPLGYLSINGDDTNLTTVFSTSLGRILRSNRNLLLAYGNSESSRENENSNEGDQVSSRTSFDVWTEVFGSKSQAGASESRLWIGYFGAHYFVSPNFLIGALVQADWSEEENSISNSSARGTGWMIGPYIAGRLPRSPLYFEARASWGQSDNEIAPIGTFRDKFSTERWMATAKVSGSFMWRDLSIVPAVSAAWYEETQERYFDSLANLIPAQTISLGEARFGPTFSRLFMMDDGSTLRPNFGVSGVWNFRVNNNNASQGFALGNSDLRARLNGGLTYQTINGWIFTADGFYDGLGIHDFYTLGGNVRVSVPFW